jgi:hypothetical protein
MPPAPKRTRRWFQFGLCAMLASVTVAALLSALVGYRLRQPVLVELDSATFGDPDYVITIKELERTGSISKVMVDWKKGYSVGSAMFNARALYDIAKARDAEYCVTLKEWKEPDGTWIMLVGFTNTKDADIQEEFGKQFSYYDDSGQKRGYLKVSDYDMLFADQEPER